HAEDVTDDAAWLAIRCVKLSYLRLKKQLIRDSHDWLRSRIRWLLSKVFRRGFLGVRGGLSLLFGHRPLPAAFASVRRFPDRSIHTYTKQQRGMRVVRADGSTRHND